MNIFEWSLVRSSIHKRQNGTEHGQVKKKKTRLWSPGDLREDLEDRGNGFRTPRPLS